MKEQTNNFEIEDKLNSLLYEYSLLIEKVYSNNSFLTGNSDCLNLEQMETTIEIQNKIYKNSQEFIKLEILKLNNK